MSGIRALLFLLVLGASMNDWSTINGVLGQGVGRAVGRRGQGRGRGRVRRPRPVPLVISTTTPVTVDLDGLERAIRDASSTAMENVNATLTAERRVVRARAERREDGPRPAGGNNGASGPREPRRGGQPSFRGVASFLGSTSEASRLSLSAKRQIELLRLVSRRLGISRAQLRALIRRNLRILARNPRAVQPDMALRDIPTDFDTCAFPDESSASVSNCNRRARSRFRTVDGTCNNLRRPLQGRSLTPLVRLLEPDYADGFDAPRHASNGSPLESARRVSRELFKPKVQKSVAHTYMMIPFGQFLDHDVTRTAISTLVPGENGDMTGVTCGDGGCSTVGVENEACLPITIPQQGEKDFTDRTCLMFVRSQPVTGRDCMLGPRQQLNQITHYIDASNVYGSNREEALKLRDLTQRRRGLMATIPNPSRRLKRLLPQGNDPECRDLNNTIRCFRAGDERVNENVGLSGIHLVMVRVHNDVEAKLRRLNPRASGNRLFEETRRIVGAIWQHIVFNEYLPTVLGPRLIKANNLGLKQSGYSTDYDPSVSAEVANVFATAAFRFSHSMISDTFTFNNQKFTDPQSVPFSTIVKRPFEIYNNRRSAGSGPDAIALGLMSQQASTIDRFFSKQITTKLFSEDPPHSLGTDLASLNLQRGRDHGIAGYNEWRKFCNLKVARNFNELVDIEDREARATLQRLYKNVNDIDLFAGAMSEKLVPGGTIGPTFGCIIAHQFRKFKVGDRFWYETNNVITRFTPDQLTEIRKITLAKLMCNSLDNVETVQKFVMLQPFRQVVQNIVESSKGRTSGSVRLDEIYQIASLYRGDLNERRPCCALPDIDYTKWRTTLRNAE